jgi:hypothetical protein
MTFTVTFKDPDGPTECIYEIAKRQVESISGLDEDEKEDLVQSKFEKLNDHCRRWFTYGEYVTIKIDTEAGTATVVPVKQ